MITIKLQKGLTNKQEEWLLKNVGPRLHYTHRSMGGQGWIVKRNYYPAGNSTTSLIEGWELTLEDDKLASFFILRCT